MNGILGSKAKAAGFSDDESGVLAYICAVYNEEAAESGRLGVDDLVAKRLGISISYLRKAFKVAIERKIRVSYDLRPDWSTRRRDYQVRSAVNESERRRLRAERG